MKPTLSDFQKRMLRHNKTIITLLFIFLWGCGTLRSQKTEPVVIPLPDVVKVLNEYSSVNPSDIQSKIQEIEDALKGSPFDEPLLRLRLSVLLSHYKNPEPDYEQALKELEIYLPSAGKDRETLLVFRSLLKALNRIYTDLASLNREKRELRQKLDLLNRENRELRQKLDLLKSLDVEIEKRRTRRR